MFQHVAQVSKCYSIILQDEHFGLPYASSMPRRQQEVFSKPSKLSWRKDEVCKKCTEVQHMPDKTRRLLRVWLPNCCSTWCSSQKTKHSFKAHEFPNQRSPVQGIPFNIQVLRKMCFSITDLKEHDLWMLTDSTQDETCLLNAATGKMLVFQPITISFLYGKQEVLFVRKHVCLFFLCEE